MPSYSSEQQKVSFLTEPDFQVFVAVPPLTLHVTLAFEPPKTLHNGRQTKCAKLFLSFKISILVELNVKGLFTWCDNDCKQVMGCSNCLTVTMTSS